MHSVKWEIWQFEASIKMTQSQIRERNIVDGAETVKQKAHNDPKDKIVGYINKRLTCNAGKKWTIKIHKNKTITPCNARG